MLTFKDFMNIYSNWNGITRVNDNDLNMIVEDRTDRLMETQEVLFDKEVVAFGFYDGELAVRVR